MQYHDDYRRISVSIRISDNTNNMINEIANNPEKIGFWKYENLSKADVITLAIREYFENHFKN